MHTYRKDGGNSGGWYVYFQQADDTPVGPLFGIECEAAAYASFLNGGRYCPDEIEALFRMEPTLVDDDSIHPDRPDFDYKLDVGGAPYQVRK